MTNTDGTASATGSDDGSLEAAANRIASLLPDAGDSDGGETPEDASSDAGDDEEAETPSDDAEESDDAAEDAEGQDEEPATYTVKIDGQEHTVTLEEALKGYQREQDYTRKTMALAEDRKALDGDRQAIAQVRDQYAQALKQVESLFQPTHDDSAELAQLRQTNPAEWAARMTEKQQQQQSLQLLRAEQQRLAAEKAGEEARERAQYAKAEEAKLLQALPEWANAETQNAEKAKLVDYALNSLGLTADEVNQIYDHRLVVALHKAAKFDALMAQKPAVQAKLQAVKTAKPGAVANAPSKVTEATRAKQRLAKTGRVQDAAAAIEALLG